jgi:predicted RNA-binding protein with PIN domain
MQSGGIGDAVLVVDVANVVGSRPDGWWRDRDGAVRRLLRSLQQHASASGDDVTLVLDGRPLGDVPEGEHDGVAVRYATRRGRNAADDRIVELVRDDDDPASLTVVTSDRDLVDRVRAHGASTVGAKSFRPSG